MNEISEKERYQRARRRVRAIRGFYKHLAVYLIINAFLFVINQQTSPDYYWFKWPLLGWGVALAIHAFSVFGARGWLGSDWEERKIREIMEKEQKDKQSGPGA